MTKFFLVLMFALLPSLGQCAMVEWGNFALVDMQPFSSGSYWLGCDGKGVVYPEISLVVTDTGDKVNVTGSMLMEGSIGTWIDCMFGDILTEKAFNNSKGAFAYANLESSGGRSLQIEKGDAFYLGCMVEKLTADWPEDWVGDWSDPRIYSGEYVYGWARLVVEVDGSLVLDRSGIDLSGNYLQVGVYGPMPEPSSVLLLLIGVASISLRRRARIGGAGCVAR